MTLIAQGMIVMALFLIAGALTVKAYQTAIKGSAQGEDFLMLMTILCYMGVLFSAIFTLIEAFLGGR